MTTREQLSRRTLTIDSALEALTSWACAEGGGDGSDSQGGGVAVGTSSDTDDGAMEFRFDPQSV